MTYLCDRSYHTTVKMEAQDPTFFLSDISRFHDNYSRCLSPCSPFALLYMGMNLYDEVKSGAHEGATTKVICDLIRTFWILTL